MQTQQWFNKMYKDYRNSIAFIDGKYKSVAQFPKGSWFRVLQVIGSGDVLATHGSTVIRIYGLADNYVDGQTLPPNLVLVADGKAYQYTTTAGSSSTVIQCQAVEIINEEQFLHAIRTGYIFD